MTEEYRKALEDVLTAVSKQAALARKDMDDFFSSKVDNLPDDVAKIATMMYSSNLTTWEKVVDLISGAIENGFTEDDLDFNMVTMELIEK